MSTDIINVAIAEDQELVRKGIIALITSPFCDKVVAEAEDGQELIDKISVMENKPDVCLVDISMPVLNGYDTVSALKKMYPEIKYLALTMYVTEYSITTMIRNGANGFLMKNCSPKTLIEAIISAHATGHYYNKFASEEIFNLVMKHTSLIQHLTEKEIQFLVLCCGSYSFDEIAEILFISRRTADDYESRLCLKLDAHNRIDLVLFAISSGLVPPKHLS